MFSLKSAIFVSVLFAIANGNLLTITHEKCIAETGIDESGVINANQGNFEDPKIKCYLKCAMLESGILRQNGNLIMPQEILVLMGDKADATVKMIEVCEPKTNEITDLCEKMYQLHTCAYNSDPKNYYLF